MAQQIKSLNSDSSAADLGKSVQSYGPSQKERDRIYAKVSRVLLPLFTLIAILNHVDRTNLAFAALQLTNELHLTAEQYGLGSGLFFSGIIISQVPQCGYTLPVG